MAALVLKRWKVDEKPIDKDGNFISISGRESGVISWLLALLRIDTTTTIKVGFDRIEFESSSMSGVNHRMIPLTSVSSSYYGYHKPWRAAVAILVTFLFLAGSVAGALVDSGEPSGAMYVGIGGFLAGLLLSVLHYLLNRTLTLGFVEHSGVVSGIQFKRSIIENVDVNAEQARQVCAISQRLIESKAKKLAGQA